MLRVSATDKSLHDDISYPDNIMFASLISIPSHHHRTQIIIRSAHVSWWMYATKE